jgi:hypothetical protein
MCPLFLVVRVHLDGAVRTDPVAELSAGMLADMGLPLVPISLVVTDLLAGSADGDQAADGYMRIRVG